MNSFPAFDLTGQIALVTGAARGLGRAISLALAHAGADVALGLRDIHADAGLPAEIQALGRRVLPLQMDVAHLDQIRRAVDDTVAHFGRLDILVNNAGVTHLPMPMEEVGEDDFERVLAVNVKSVYLTARALVPHFKARRAGTILNIASTAAVSPRPRLSWYNASKGWMVTATKSMAIELAPFGVRVNAINPVAGETPLLKTFMGEDTPEIRAKFLSTIPLGRFSTPEDMGNAACFLCSDEASMITGVAMEVDGGRVI